MNYVKISKMSISNGVGIRVVLWVSGCSHHCDGCHNPQTWNENAGKKFTEETLAILDSELSKPYVRGVTFSGGDPLFEYNRECIYEIIKHIREKFPDKDIWLWTGYLWEEIKHLDVIKYVDVLIDGEYDKSKRDITLAWRGSSNQKVINVKESLKKNRIVLYCD